MTKVLVENFQRENPSAVAEARAIQTIIDQTGRSQAEVAKMLGCDPSQVSHRLSLLKLAIPEPEPTPLIEAPESDSTEDEETVEVTDTHETETEDPSEPDAEVDESTPDAEIVETMEATPEPPEKPAKKPFDILAKVESGELSASVAEVAVGLDNPEDREKLAKLAIANGWSVKRAQNWVKSIKENVVDPDEKLAKFGELEMIRMDDVTTLPYLKPRELSQQEEGRLMLYSQLRSYLDREVTDYIEQTFGIPYENLWDYVSTLEDSEVQELSRRMLRRFIASPHRFPSLEVSIKDDFGTVEIKPDPAEDEQLSLPGAEEEVFDLEEEMFMLPEIE